MNIFKQLELVGFKSFPDKINVTFDGGITAIVGPNGCGKSNVADAIRWVLGEQSAKLLRGKSMFDVIFSGTEKRKPLSYCEVSLVFDNTKRWFNIEFDEVIFTRKLYRSGDSEYCINRNSCRRKDIIDLLYDSGIGKDGYSIIGQGKIDEILMSRPEDRRAIFEEAASISKYKAKKEESESRLDRTRDNVSRLMIKYNEVGNQLAPLKKQSEDAKLFLELRDRLKDLEINSYLYQYENANRIKSEIEAKTKGLSENLSIKQSELNIYQVKYDQNMNEINRIDQTISALRDDVLNYTVLLEKRQGESNLLNERLQHLMMREQIISDQLNKSQLDFEQTNTLIDVINQRSEEENDHLLELRKKTDQLSNKYLEVIDDITRSEGEADKSQRAIIENLTRLTDIKANMSALLAKRDNLNENIRINNEKLNEIITEKEEVKNTLDNLKSEIARIEVEKAKCEKTVEKTKTSIFDTKNKISDLTEQIFSIKSGLSNDTNRKNLLVNLQTEFEGYQFAVKKLLQDAKQNNSLAASILGVVGNVIEVDEKYQTAIEVALGSSIQNIITADENNAKNLINYLKQNHFGRATFLPLNAVKIRNFENKDKQYLSCAGCLGIASELIKYPNKFERAISSLLGSTVIVDNLDNAVNIAKKSGYSFRIVTLEGDVLSPQGAISGGSKKNIDSSLLSKESEIKALTDNIEKNTILLEKLNKEYIDLSNMYDSLNEVYNENVEHLQNLNNNYYSSASKLEGLQDKHDDLKFDSEILEKQINSANEFVNELTQKINSVDTIENDISESQQQVDTSLNLRQSVFSDLKQKREQYNEQVTVLKMEIAKSEEKIHSYAESIVKYKEDCVDLQKQIDNLQTELDKQTSIISSARQMQTSEESNAEHNDVVVKLNETNSKLSSFDEFKQHLQQELKEIDTQKMSILEEISKLQNRVFQEESKLQKVDIDMEIMQERIFEDYEFTYNDCLAFKRDDYEFKSGMIELNKVKNQINALGYVNVQAIEQYKLVGERYDIMTTQLEDLAKTEKDLLEIIKELSHEMLAKFNTEFEKINENFGQVFKELFGGGKASLQLLDSEDPLKAGVDIQAQPPGKVLQSISLLSGGEKALTAIAILFAILKLRPTPFCILDEIEAALDDANVERFAKYLQRFSQRTQFIVITHKKQSMELADNLYGVTMEENGISKIVSVKLGDAITNVKKD